MKHVNNNRKYLFASNLKVKFVHFALGCQWETLGVYINERKLRNSRQSREKRIVFFACTFCFPMQITWWYSREYFLWNFISAHAYVRIYNEKTKETAQTTHVICIGKPKLPSQRDEFRAMQIIIAIRSIDIQSRLREFMTKFQNRKKIFK